MQNDIVSSRENKIYFDTRSERDEFYDHVECRILPFNIEDRKKHKCDNVTNDQIDRFPPIRIYVIHTCTIRICIVYTKLNKLRNLRNMHNNIIIRNLRIDRKFLLHITYKLISSRSSFFLSEGFKFLI